MNTFILFVLFLVIIVVVYLKLIQLTSKVGSAENDPRATRLDAMKHTLVRPAHKSDLDWIKPLEVQNYGKDGWDYTPKEWESEINVCNPYYGTPGYGNILRVYENYKNPSTRAYIQYSYQPSRGWYLVTIGGNEIGAKFLIKYLLSHGGRIYTHSKPEWFNGKVYDILANFGFKDIGFGDNSRETGKWIEDLSKMHEHEMYFPIEF